MTEMSDECRRIREALVGYADGDLDPAQAAPVAEHLERCERCRRLLGDLRGSLELAKGVWQQAARSGPGAEWVPQLRTRPAMGRRLVMGGFAAAACVVIAVGVVIWLHRPSPEPPAVQTVSLAQAEETIQRAEDSARLLACADILAGQPGCGDQAKDLYDYVSRTYGDADAVRRRTRTSHPADQGVNQ